MLKDMKTKTHLKPGQKGTKRLLEKYGDSLLCVRYRYDDKRGIRFKTVEIVVEEIPWKPCLRYKDADIVAVIIQYNDLHLREKIKIAGGKWDTDKKVWHIQYGSIRGIAEFEERILRD